MIHIPVDSITALIRQAGREIILPRFGNLTSDEVKTKSAPDDWVTVVDPMAEKWLKRRLLPLVPGSRIVGEEATGLGRVPSVIAASFAAPVWTLDPIDGTELYMNGDPRFATMASLTHQGEILAAWIHFPVSNVTLVAEKGAGAFRGDQKLSMLETANDAPVSGLVVMPGGHHVEGKKLLAQKYPEFFSRTYPPANAASEYAQLVTSFQPGAGAKALPQYDYFLRLFGGHALKPWDHLPGQLIAQEAGAKVLTVSNQKINMDNLNEGILVAAPALWDRMHNATRGEKLIYG